VAPFWVGRAVGGLLYQGGPGSATRDGAGEPDPTQRGARVARPPRRIGAWRRLGGLGRMGPPVEWR